MQKKERKPSFFKKLAGAPGLFLLMAMAGAGLIIRSVVTLIAEGALGFGFITGCCLIAFAVIFWWVEYIYPKRVGVARYQEMIAQNEARYQEEMAAQQAKEEARK